MDGGTMKDYIEDLIQQSNAAAQVMEQAADEIERLRQLLKEFYDESQCIDCYTHDAGLDPWIGSDGHSPDDCPIAKLQNQYVDIFGEDDD